MISHLPAFVGAVLQTTCQMADAPELLMVGRFVQGINCGESTAHLLRRLLLETSCLSGLRQLSHMRGRLWVQNLSAVSAGRCARGRHRVASCMTSRDRLELRHSKSMRALCVGVFDLRESK